MGRPKRHELGVIEGEVNSDIMTAVESPSTLLLFLDPGDKRLSDELQVEGFHLLRLRAYSVDGTINKAIIIASVVALTVLIDFVNLNQLVAVLFIPVAIMPLWVLAASTVPVAVIVL